MSRRSLPPITHRSPPAPAAARTLHTALLTALLPTRPIDASTHRRTNRRTARSNEIAHPPAITRNVYGSHSPSISAAAQQSSPPTRCQTPVAIQRQTPSIAAADTRPRPPILANDLRGPPARQSPLTCHPRPPAGPHAHVRLLSQGHTCIMTPA